MYKHKRSTLRIPLLARINWFLAFVVLWFTTLPSLDKPVTIINKDGATCHLHPSRGTYASTTCIDGQWYIRTGRGFRKCSRWLGEMRQEAARKKRTRAIADRVVVGGSSLAIAAGLVAISLAGVR